MPTIRRMTPIALTSRPSASAVTPHVRIAPTAINKMLTEIPMRPILPAVALSKRQASRREHEVPRHLRVLARPLLEPPQRQPGAGHRGDDFAEDGPRGISRRASARKRRGTPPPGARHGAEARRRSSGQRRHRRPRVDVPEAPERAVAGVDEIPAPEQELGRKGMHVGVHPRQLGQPPPCGVDRALVVVDTRDEARARSGRATRARCHKRGEGRGCRSRRAAAPGSGRASRAWRARSRRCGERRRTLGGYGRSAPSTLGVRSRRRRSGSGRGSSPPRRSRGR